MTKPKWAEGLNYLTVAIMSISRIYTVAIMSILRILTVTIMSG